MLRKLKSTPGMFLLSLILLTLGVVLTFEDSFMARNRTNPVTTAEYSNLEQSSKQNEESQSDPDQNESLNEPTEPLSPPVPSKRIPGTRLSDEILEDLNVDERIEQEEVFFATAAPNDPIYPQWYSTIIDAPVAWDTSTGSASTLVAVIDTGFALAHEDLTSAWFVNAGEQGTTSSGDACWTGSPENKQTNNCDDDDNGWVDDWRGWDFANNDNSPQAGENYASGSTHGTKTSGLVGARGNNATGVASVNWQTQILPLQGLYDQGYGYSSDIAAAIYYAVEMGADVINMSLGGPSPDSYTLAAVQYAEERNVIVVASSGNCGANQTDPDCVGYPSPGGMGYPGRYTETIAVGATTSTDVRASFSSYGEELDIVAPGSGTIQTPTWSTANGTSLYSSTSYGTSFSAPIVAGIVGTIKGQFPNVTRQEVIALLQNSADKVSGMGSSNWTQEYGYGRVNYANLLSELAVYERQLTKTGGLYIPESSTTTPQVSTNTGHKLSSQIVGGTTVRTYCLAEPRKLCSLRFKKQGTTTTINFTSKLTNNQGLAVFYWDKSDLGSGVWNIRALSGSKQSEVETVYIK